MPDLDSNLEPALRDHAAGMQQMLQDWQQDFSKRHQVEVDCGLGSVYKLSELQKSYQEARMTLSYGRTKHEHGFFRYYEDCGILSNIFAGGVEQPSRSAVRLSGACSTMMVRMMPISWRRSSFS